jgi:hypothetical protein
MGCKGPSPGGAHLTCVRMASRSGRWWRNNMDDVRPQRATLLPHPHPSPLSLLLRHDEHGERTNSRQRTPPRVLPEEGMSPLACPSAEHSRRRCVCAERRAQGGHDIPQMESGDSAGTRVASGGEGSAAQSEFQPPERRRRRPRHAADSFPVQHRRLSQQFDQARGSTAQSADGPYSPGDGAMEERDE